MLLCAPSLPSPPPLALLTGENVGSDNAETYGWAPAGPWGNGTQHGAVPSCANQYLMNDLARGEWGFDGYITSDCNAVNDVLGPSGGTRGKCLCCPPASIPWANLIHQPMLRQL